MSKIKVLIFDKNKLYKDAISHLLKNKEKIKSVFSISQYEHVIPVLEKFLPDLVLINNLDVTREELEKLVKNIKAIDKQINIFILNNKEVFFNTRLERYIDLKISVSKDHKYLYSMITKYVNTISNDSVKEVNTEFKFHNLTKREMDVMELISQGFTNRAISEELVISERTVKNHVSSILKKLSVNDRTQALIKCLKKGIVNLE
ncbi:MAG: response regulator transcription factor [Halanaerobiales bacterium]|nr:response regulator transcription factor [Halanaerobiales bacterium]